MPTSSTMIEHLDTQIEINTGDDKNCFKGLVFSTDGERLMSGDRKSVRVWRVQDGKEVATLKTPGEVNCLAMSNDGRWLAGGTNQGYTFVWNTEAYEIAMQLRRDCSNISGVDFSPDATRLVVASNNGTASVWDVATGQRKLTLSGSYTINHYVRAAKYSPQGDRIATATVAANSSDFVRVYDSGDGRLLLDIPRVGIVPSFNTGLLWFGDYLLLMHKNARGIEQFDASTGSTVSNWRVHSPSFGDACIALSAHAQFVACSSHRNISFWDASSHAQLALIQHSQYTCSIAFSPDDQFLAIGGRGSKITIKNLSRITTSIREKRLQDEPENAEECQDPSRIVNPITFSELELQIDDNILDPWKRGLLQDAEALLTEAIIASQNTAYPLFASRALVRAHLRKWDTALVDAEMALKIQPSVMGYIAKSIAHVGRGERYVGYQTCDAALASFHSSHTAFPLLIKAIIMFMAGEYRDAISRIRDLINTVPFNPIYHAVQSYMYLVDGKLHMDNSDYESAIQSFEHAASQVQHDASRPLLTISLIFGWELDDLGTIVRQRLCEALYATGRIKDAAERFCEMFGKETMTKLQGEHLEWALDFRRCASEKVEHLGDTAVDAQQYDEAISHYTTALSLDLPSPEVILVKRSKAFVATGSWRQALDDARQMIMLDASSPWGYEMKHAALHRGGEFKDAVEAFETMLSRITESPDAGTQRRGDQYVSPSSTRATIRRIIQRTIRYTPRVLINTTTGRLHNKVEQASAFESLPTFNELVSSMTTRIDYVRIKHEVRQYFRYVMLSHKWEDNEPLFQDVVHIAVYNLDKSATHDKLQTFCKLVQDAGFNWAWCDTCCIDKSDHFVLQEALVAMFRWYQGSAMMFVFLRGIGSAAQRGALVRSVWNTRAWTLQEYIASKVIHFYTEDWTLYLDLELPNHKESPEVILEMEQATGVSAEQLVALRPGLTGIREKLCLASTRQTTLVEDTAYSLLGIFSVAGMSAIYGEGEASLGRLLAHLLTGSGDVSILAWTGESSSYNSCLPAHITVFNGPATSHLPLPIPDAEMERTVAAPPNPSFDLAVALRLYDRLAELPTPWFAACRMRLPCIAFQLPPFKSYRTRLGRVYRADTVAFGRVEIKTRHDLSRMNSMYLVHPWLDALLEREDVPSGGFVEDETAPSSSDDSESETEVDDDEFEEASSSVLEPETPLRPPVHTLPIDRETRARRLVARLEQPFGALLVTLVATGRRATDYKRVAADSVITVRFQENVSLADFLDNVRTLDVL